MIRIAETTAMKWNEKVTQWLSTHKRTPGWLAKQLGINASRLHHALSAQDPWENVAVAIKLAQLLDTTVEALWDESLDLDQTPPRLSRREETLAAIRALERIARGDPAPADNETEAGD